MFYIKLCVGDHTYDAFLTMTYSVLNTIETDIFVFCFDFAFVDILFISVFQLRL